jgi:hypothetical protein
MIVIFTPKTAEEFNLPIDGPLSFDDVKSMFTDDQPRWVFYWYNKFDNSPVNISACDGKSVAHGFMLAELDGAWEGRIISHCSCIAPHKNVQFYDINRNVKEIWQDLFHDNKLRYKHVFKAARDYTEL